MQQYTELLREILTLGRRSENRTGVSTLSLFGRSLRFDLQEGFPLVTEKRVPLKSMVAELVWFLKGNTNADTLAAMGSTIWDEWAVPVEVSQERQLSNYERAMEYANKACLSVQDAISVLTTKGADAAGHAFLDEQGIPRSAKRLVAKKGELGPIYGYQWRHWRSWTGEVIDQMDELVANLREKPFSRRHVITAWNPSDLPNEAIPPHQNAIQGRMALAPCHMIFQFNVREMTATERLKHYNHLAMSQGHSPMTASDLVSDETIHAEMDREGAPKYFLDCMMTQRSCDAALGLPFNIASYALLTHLIAHHTGTMAAGDLIISLGNVHIYDNQLEGVETLLSREERSLPVLAIWELPHRTRLEDYGVEELVALVKNYDPHPAIPMPVAV